MNKIYRIIYNEITGTYNAVAETAKAKGKNSSKTIGLIGVALLSASSITQANWVNSDPNDPTIKYGIANGTAQIAIGSGNTAATQANVSQTASDGIAIGSAASTKGGQGISLGKDSQAGSASNEINNIAIGTNSKALVGNNSTAVGSSAVAQGENVTSLGASASATGRNSTALGTTSSAIGSEATSIGSSSNAIGSQSTAIGQGATALVTNSTAIGSNSNATGTRSTAIGQGTSALGIESTAIGAGSTATGSQSTAIGQGANSVTAATAIGKGASATDSAATALGTNTQATGGSVAIGAISDSADASIIYGATASDIAAVAIGGGSTASGADSTAIGTYSSATQEGSIAIGGAKEKDKAAVSSALNSVAIGLGAKASNDNSVALGANSVTGTAIGTSSATVNEIQYGNFAGATPSSVVSIGQADQERQLQNVAAGQVLNSSTDAINGSQLFATQEVIAKIANSTKTIIGGDTQVNPDGTITPPTNLGDTGKDNVDDAIRAVNQGWNYTAAGANSQNVKSGNTVDFKNTDKNINITADAQGLTFDLAKDVTIANSLTVGTVKIDPNGINAGNKVIANLAEGVAGTDAVNVNQLNKSITDNAYTGWSFTGNDKNGTTTSTEVKTGNTVAFKNTDNNLTVQAANTDLQIGLSDDVKINNSLSVGPVVINKATGINAGDLNISNVKAGVAPTDAVNLSQLTKLGNETADSLGGASKYDPSTGDLTTELTVNGNTYDTVQKALDNIKAGSWDLTVNNDSAKKQTIDAGNPLSINGDPNISVNSTQGNVNVSLKDDVNITKSLTVAGGVQIDGNGINAADKKINNVADGDVSATSKDAVNGSQLKAVKDTAEAGWNYTANGTNQQNVKPTESVDFKNTDKNINITADQNGLTFDLADDVKVNNSLTVGTNTTLNNNGLTIVGGPSVTTTGINAGNKVISNVAAGVQTNDAVNVGQLKDLQNTVDLGWNITANGQNPQNIKNGSTLDLKNIDGNIAIQADPQTGTIQFNLADQVIVNDSVLVGGNTLLNQNGLSFTNGGPSVTSNGIDAGNKKITNVEAGEISKTSKDAINGSQLKGSLDSVQNILGGNSTVNPDGTLNMSNIGGTGQNNIHDAIQTVNNTVNAGWTLKGKDDAGNDINTQVKPNSSVEITNKDSNISVQQSQDANGNAKVEIGLNKDISVDSVTANKVQVGGVSIDQNGIHAGNKVISNVAAGVNDTDAVNVSQLKDSISNIDGVVKYEKNPDGTYNHDKVNLEGTAAKVDPAGKQVTSGGTTITNVANGKAPADAVNYGQLTKSNDTIVEYLGGGAAYNNITQSFTAPSYKVDGNTYNNVGDALGATNTRIDNLKIDVNNKFENVNNRIDDLGDELKAGIASAMAVQNAPYVSGKFTYAVGAAHYSGEQAVGISLRKTADNGRWSLNGGVSAATQGDPGFLIGISGVID